MIKARGSSLVAILISTSPSCQRPSNRTDEAPPQTEALEAVAIGRAVGVEARTSKDGVVRVTWPRTDVVVRVDGMTFPASAGLTSWAGFMSVEGGAMVMGDTVVFEDEVNPAMDAAFANGLEVTALHNHFFFDEPKVYFMHVGGRGDPTQLAKGVKAIWESIRAVRGSRPEPASGFGGETPKPGRIDSPALERILSMSSSANNGVVKFSVGRDAAMGGNRFSGAMGLTTWAAFTGTDVLATVDGDFAMTAAEVQPVLRALRAAGIHIVALHNHMVGEVPAFYFTHFWGKGPAQELARGIRSAIVAQLGAVVRPPLE